MRLETEQMAAVYSYGDHRQGSHPTPSVKVEHTATTTLDDPMTAAQLSAFIDTLPAEAVVAVSTIQGGSQRDPYTTGYQLTAKW